MLTLSPNAPYWPNAISGTVNPASTNWLIIGINKSTRVVTAYTSKALLLAAGDRLFPGLDPGGRIGQCLLNSVDSTLMAPGGPVLYKCDPITAPTTAADADNVEFGETQQISLPCPFRELWLKFTDATDYAKLAGRY